ncbi:hypothetical protein IWQ60_009817 [Tieghemiomyces parasiticus]|uniref:Glycosyl transferase family 25 domain-containing protein n=1 Tax=Tieghemiomyces parasiticus TaxID=78921 RepID=A0A9W7ZTF4_9FUNG|nr:hypothetical protein IWQ60_009817 [Tieghemiomyces parasiticus]
MARISVNPDYEAESDLAGESLHLYDPTTTGRSLRSRRKRCITLGVLSLCGFMLFTLTIFNTANTVAILDTLRDRVYVQSGNWIYGQSSTKDGAEASTRAGQNATLTPELIRVQRIREAEQLSESVLGHTYVINLAKRTDRRDTMTNLFSYLNIPIEFRTAATPATMEFIPPSAEKANMGKSHLACWRSHMDTLQDIVRNKYAWATVFEDDVSTETDLVGRVQALLPKLPADWDMFYLGHCSTGKFFGPPLKSTSHIRILNGAWCTHAYMVNLRGARKLLKLLAHPDRPVDNMIADLGMAHQIATYAVDPAPVVQIRGSDDPSDISPGSGRLSEHLDHDGRKALEDMIKTSDSKLLS